MGKLLVSILCVLALTPALAMNYEIDPSTPPEVQKWYAAAKRSDQEAVLSCCGIADAYWTDELDVVGSDVFAIITDARKISGRYEIPVGTRFRIPPEVMDKRRQGNPTGHRITFISGGGIVICFFDSTGI